MDAVGLEMIVSGGQTGVDQAALEAAIRLQIPHGGWCPKGRRCENGVIPERYSLREMESQKYEKRTEQNVIDSDATLILYRDRIMGGTARTLRMTRKHFRPCLAVDLRGRYEIPTIQNWLQESKVAVVNVAGPRESTNPGIYDESLQVLISLFFSYSDYIESQQGAGLEK